MTPWALSPLLGLCPHHNLCHFVSSQVQPRGGSSPGVWVVAGVDLLALALGRLLALGWLLSGLGVKHSTASPCPWLCQPHRKGADISAFVHFMGIYGHLGSLLTPSSQG